MTDYIDKAIEESKKEGVEDQLGKTGDVLLLVSPFQPFNKTRYLQVIFVKQSSGTPELAGEDIYSDTQPDSTLADMNQIVESIPQLQAQISQLSAMLQNPSLPNQVRMQTEMQYSQVQYQLNNAQAFTVALAAATSFQQQATAAANYNYSMTMGAAMGDMTGGVGGTGTPYQTPQQPGPDSAYQRLPVNNRRKNLKRERPSDFLEVGGEDQRRHWE